MKNILRIKTGVLIAALIFSVGAISTWAQSPADNTSVNDQKTATASSSADFNRNDLYAGYSYQRYDVTPRFGFNGAEISYTRNLRRFFGVTGAFATRIARDNCTECGPGGVSKRSHYSLQGGVRFKDNRSTARLKPFGHALAGWIQNRGKLCDNSGSCGNQVVVNGFTFTVGGGLDVRLNRRVELRVLQVDYNPTVANGFRYDNVNVGFGIVFR